MTASPTETVHLHSARREARAVAAAIDLLVIAGIGALFAVIATIAMLLQVDPFQRDPTNGEWAVGYSVWLLFIPASIAYASMGHRTLGARALTLSLSDSAPWRLALRGLMWWPSAILLCVGLWWSWLDSDGRSLTDRISGATLVETPKTVKR